MTRYKNVSFFDTKENYECEGILIINDFINGNIYAETIRDKSREGEEVKQFIQKLIKEKIILKDHDLEIRFFKEPFMRSELKSYINKKLIY